MKSISKIRQSDLYLHFFNIEKKCTLSLIRKNIFVIYSCFIWLSFLFGVERKKQTNKTKTKLKKKKTPTASTKINTELRSTAVLPYVKGLSEQIRRKDAVDLAKQDRVVYRIPCECRKIYIGETGRPMQERISEHAHNTG